jgi:hypothetical protein
MAWCVASPTGDQALSQDSRQKLNKKTEQTTMVKLGSSLRIRFPTDATSPLILLIFDSIQ